MSNREATQISVNRFGHARLHLAKLYLIDPVSDPEAFPPVPVVFGAAVFAQNADGFDENEGSPQDR